MIHFKPSSDYDSLLKQARALANLANSLERRLSVESASRQIDWAARMQLDSQRQANETLTAELEVSQARVKQLESELRSRSSS